MSSSRILNLVLLSLWQNGPRYMWQLQHLMPSVPLPVIESAVNFLEATHRITRSDFASPRYELTSSGRDEARRLTRKNARPTFTQAVA